MATGFTYTVQDIVNGTSQDLRKQLAASGSDANILMDYVDRIHKEVLRTSKWKFLLSGPQQFVTQLGVNDYWIGTSGSAPAGQFDTGLNLTDVFKMDDKSVLDRSNQLQLARIFDKPPNLATFEFPDGSSRQLRPSNYFHDDYSTTLSLYPAPNNQNTYQPQPESPICTTSAGGALAARTYYVRYSIVDTAGNESNASANATTIFVPANNLLVVKKPNLPSFKSASGVSYSKFNVYASATSGSEVLQSSNNTADWTEAVGGLSTGTAAYPTANNLTELLGYVVEFRYWKLRAALTSLSQALQVPDDYKDVLTHGVNWLGYLYLQKMTEAQAWSTIYQQGLRELIRDKNQFFNNDFISPDPTSQTYPPGIVPGFFSS